MCRSTRHVVGAAALATLLFVRLAAQQTALTDAQLKSADIEVPRLMQLLELAPGMTVADVGAGFGAWTMRFARSLGPQGRVYATDIGAPQLASLRDSVKREGLGNVTVIEGAAASTNLPPLCCDAILVRDAYHHFTNPDDMIKSLAASLKPGGRLAIVDFPPRPNSEVPAGVRANRRGHGVPPEVVQEEVRAALTHVRTIPDWSPEGQPASLFLVLFRKP
jgi:cyclopropane fatty-acyl-phospholipid synthase-like methyltransferase